MDKFLKGKQHISKISSQLYLQLKNIHQIRRQLDFASANSVVQAIIMSRLDYCSSLLVGTPEYQLDRLQHLQNMACRVCVQCPHAWSCIHKHESLSTGYNPWENSLQDCFPSVEMQKQPSSRLSGWSTYQNKDITGISGHQYQTITPLPSTKTNLQLSPSLSLVGPQTWNTLPKCVTSSTTKDTFKTNSQDIHVHKILWISITFLPCKVFL